MTILIEKGHETQLARILAELTRERIGYEVRERESGHYEVLIDPGY